MSKIVTTNVGELIAALSKFPDDTRIFTIEPPFTGLAIVPQDDGGILFCRPCSFPKEKTVMNPKNNS
jgi:hypothetical protein